MQYVEWREQHKDEVNKLFKYLELNKIFKIFGVIRMSNIDTDPVWVIKILNPNVCIEQAVYFRDLLKSELESGSKQRKLTKPLVKTRAKQAGLEQDASFPLCKFVQSVVLNYGGRSLQGGEYMYFGLDIPAKRLMVSEVKRVWVTNNVTYCNKATKLKPKPVRKIRTD